MSKYKIKSGISEKQVEADVAGFLGMITPFWSRRLRLLDVDEQETGADKLFENSQVLPLYLQFKVSEGLIPIKPGNKIAEGFRNKPLPKIREFRKEKEIDSAPILYFKLRKKAKNASEFQHNILKRLNDQENQYGVYVAPLTLKNNEYEQMLNPSYWERLFGTLPFIYEDRDLLFSEYKRSLQYVPFLRGHISIPPHEKIDTDKHYYSYSKSGFEIAWHSGEEVEGDFRLSTWYLARLNEIYNEKNRHLISKEEYFSSIQEIVNEYFDPPPVENIENRESLLKWFVKELYQRFGIKTLFLVNENVK